MTVRLTRKCECLSMIPSPRFQRRPDGTPVPSQSTMVPKVNADLKKFVIGKHRLTVLSYTCERCGEELGQMCVGTDGGQTNLFDGVVG